MTDASLQALVEAGCGKNLTSLRFYRECPFSCFPSFSAEKATNRADLGEGVTDAGLQALAEAGCGTNLMSLTLRGECHFLASLPPPFCLQKREQRTAQP